MTTNHGNLIAVLIAVLCSFLAGFLVAQKYERLGFHLFGDNGVFRGKNNEASFTRTGAAVLVLLALAVWAVGIYFPAITAYCSTMIDRMVELAKWIFSIGKGTEEIGRINMPKKDEDPK